MSISIKKLKTLQPIDCVIIHAIDISLYQVSVMIDGQEHYVADKKGKLLRAFNKLELQALFETIPHRKMLLRHHSAYDEMVGQPPRQGSNQLEVDLGNSELATESPSIH